MMSINTEDVMDFSDRELEALNEVYIAKLPQKILQLEEMWKELQSYPDYNEEAYKKLSLATHTLIGSTATFGFEALSKVLLQIEICIKLFLESKSKPTEIYIDQIEGLLQAASELTNKANRKQNFQHLTGLPSSFRQAQIKQTPSNISVLLLENDLAYAQTLITQMEYFGYDIHLCNKLEELQDNLIRYQPAVLIIDTEFPIGRFNTIDNVIKAQEKLGKTVPMIFMSDYSDLNMRLMMVRGGAHAYFEKPVGINNLIDKLDAITAHKPFEPFRILIIDDDKVLSAYYASVLSKAGMVTEVINEPFRFNQPLVDFAPDLILMDLYMPDCSGLELAAVIRQQEAYVSIPIVFLSSEKNLDKQLDAMNLGDDFLNKPIQPSHLVSAVSARVQRSRVLRTLVSRDGLTGLLNHTSLKKQLNVEVARAERNKQPLSFAMLDLDHFKAINDTYGHSIGDQVLRSLARLLQQRLRRTDIIGRYGGEEFAIILPNTDFLAAAKMMEQLKNNFGQLRQQASDREFYSSFSCGISSYPYFKTSASINDAADKAMYEAKRLGRNRVECA